MTLSSEKLGIATRFYGLDPQDIERLREWVEAALVVVPAEQIFVAVNVDTDRTGARDFLKTNYPDIVSFPVTPWGKVVQGPNAILLKAAEQVSHLLFTSTEYPVRVPLVEKLQKHIDDNTLVVGVVLTGHTFTPGVVEKANGSQIPWNTYALWSLSHLVHTGFVLTADSFTDPSNAGMEEMGTIAAQQILWPGRAKAKLIRPDEGTLFFNTHGWTIERQERYHRNLEGKDARSQAQLERLSLTPPSVEHID